MHAVFFLLFVALLAAARVNGTASRDVTLADADSTSLSSMSFVATPYYADPLFDAAHDAEFVWNVAEQCYWLIYLQNRYASPIADVKGPCACRYFAQFFQRFCCRARCTQSHTHLQH
jgi:hypothetical protein